MHNLHPVSEKLGKDQDAGHRQVLHNRRGTPGMGNPLGLAAGLHLAQEQIQQAGVFAMEAVEQVGWATACIRSYRSATLGQQRPQTPLPGPEAARS